MCVLAFILGEWGYFILWGRWWGISESLADEGKLNGGYGLMMVGGSNPQDSMYQLKKFQCHTFFASQDIKQNVLLTH